jgi:hypothetical protein
VSPPLPFGAFPYYHASFVTSHKFFDMLAKGQALCGTGGPRKSGAFKYDRLSAENIKKEFVAGKSSDHWAAEFQGLGFQRGTSTASGGPDA